MHEGFNKGKMDIGELDIFMVRYVTSYHTPPPIIIWVVPNELTSTELHSLMSRSSNEKDLKPQNFYIFENTKPLKRPGHAKPN